MNGSRVWQAFVGTIPSWLSCRWVGSHTCLLWQVTDLTGMRLCGGIDPIHSALWQAVGSGHVWQAHARCLIPPRLLTGGMLLAYFGRGLISLA